jgi:hypothetical protein
MPLNWIASTARAHAIARRVADAGWRDGKNPPIIYVPGILGVKLHDRVNHADIWGDARAILRRDRRHASYALDRDDDHAPRDVIAHETLHHFSIASRLVTTLVTAELVAVLERALGYRLGRDLFFLNHDWRRDYRHVAERLELEIRRIQLDFGRLQRVIVIGQSVANLAIRFLVRTCSQDLRDRIARWYAFGPPWQGTFNALKLLREGYYPATRRFHGFSPRDAATFASCFQLLPHHAAMLDGRGAPIGGFDLYAAACWQAHGLGDPATPSPELQRRLDDARAFAGEISGSESREQAIDQVWFVGANNHAVCAAIAHAGGALVSERAIRKHHPELADRALAVGDDHIPLAHLTGVAPGPVVRSYDSLPYGERYVAIGMAKDHRALINYPGNLHALAMDIAAVRSNEARS